MSKDKKSSRKYKKKKEKKEKTKKSEQPKSEKPPSPVMSETSATSISDEPEHSFVSDFISSTMGRKIIIWMVNIVFLGAALYCLVTAFATETYVMLLPAFILASGLGGMIAFKPLDKKQRELQEQREREIEEATDMGLVA